jgi:hypothetical protein
VRPVPDRAVDARRISRNSFNSSKRRARGRVLTPQPPPRVANRRMCSIGCVA